MAVGRFANALIKTSLWSRAQHGPLMRGTVLRTAREHSADQDSEPVARSAGLRWVGTRFGTVLEKAFEDKDVLATALEAMDKMGDSTYQGHPAEIVAKVREALCAEFHTSPDADAGVNRSQYHSKLWEALLKAAEDPETEIPEWMRTGFPTGAGDTPLKASGVFPPMEKDTAAVENSRVYAKLLEGKIFRPDEHTNYKSFYEMEGGLAQKELDRITSLSFLQTFYIWAAVLLLWPLAAASKMAMIVKQRDDLSLKVRFIIDLLRSGVNGGVHVPERVILPRLTDFAAGVVNLLLFQWRARRNSPEVASKEEEEDLGVELGVIDFSDAFYTLWVKEQERGLLVIRTLIGWAVFLRICFGLASAPLLWGRVAAAGCRLAQAIFLPHEFRLQCYVDDPAFAVAGTPLERRRLAAMFLLFMAILGFSFSWGKGAWGKKIQWIGVQVYLAMHLGYPALRAELGEKKLKELLESVTNLRVATGMVSLALVRRLAGQLAWAGSLFVWIRAFNGCLWAALTAHHSETTKTKDKTRGGRLRPTSLFFINRIDHALKWIDLLIQGRLHDKDGKRILMGR